MQSSNATVSAVKEDTGEAKNTPRKATGKICRRPPLMTTASMTHAAAEQESRRVPPSEWHMKSASSEENCCMARGHFFEPTPTALHGTIDEEICYLVVFASVP